MRLLIIDDSQLDRRKIKRLVTQMKANASVAEAQCVESALGMVAVERFDCILVDYHMPGIDGIELARQIAANHGGLVTPMVMLTGEPSPILAREALESGFADFLGKRSLSADGLRQTLCNAIIKSQAAETSSISEDGEAARHANRSNAKKNQLITEALGLLGNSEAIQKAIQVDAEAATAIELLQRASAAP